MKKCQVACYLFVFMLLKYAWYFIVGIPNGYSSSSIPAKYWWGIWWNTSALDCWCVYSLAVGHCCCLSLQIIKVYRQLCDASNTFHLLLPYEAFFGPQVYILCLSSYALSVFILAIILWVYRDLNFMQSAIEYFHLLAFVNGVCLHCVNVLVCKWMFVQNKKDF